MSAVVGAGSAVKVSTTWPPSSTSLTSLVTSIVGFTGAADATSGAVVVGGVVEGGVVGGVVVEGGTAVGREGTSREPGRSGALVPPPPPDVKVDASSDPAVSGTLGWIEAATVLALPIW